MNENLIVFFIWSFGVILNFLNLKFKIIKNYYFLLIFNSLIFIAIPVYLSTLG